MTAAQKVQSTQRSLAIVAVVVALSWAVAGVLLTLIVGTVLSAFVGLPEWLRNAIPLIAGAVGLGLLAWLGYRERYVWSSPKVALWIEERAPQLRYALVTALDPRYAELEGSLLGPVVSAVDTGSFVRRSMQATMLPAVLALVAASAAYAAVPTSWKAKIVGSRSSGPTELVDNRPSRLKPISGKITPPQYAIEGGVQGEELKDPSSITGLIGSTIELHGPGDPDGIGAQLGDSGAKMPLTGNKDGWNLTFPMPDSARLLLMTDRKFRGTVVLVPKIDDIPSAQLILPSRDTTVRTVQGSITYDAVLTDDIGLGEAIFKYDIIMGGGEDITVRSGEFGKKMFSNDKRGRLTFTIPLSTFGLKEGDQLQVKAEVRDRNNVTGPGIGWSEVRVLRVARSGEYDSLAVDPAPPPDDTSLMTLRRLIQDAIELQAVKKKIERDEFVSRSNKIANGVDRMIAKVDALQAAWVQDGMFQPDTLLVIAHDALYSATRSLRIAYVHEAIPEMWKAWRALRKFMFAKKHYFEGIQKQEIVNIEKERLIGTDTGYATDRFPRGIADANRRKLLEEFIEAVKVMKTSTDSASEMFSRLLVNCLREFPNPADAGKILVPIEELRAALRDKKDPTVFLVRIREFLGGRVDAIDSIPTWGGAW